MMVIALNGVNSHALIMVRVGDRVTYGEEPEIYIVKKVKRAPPIKQRGGFSFIHCESDNGVRITGPSRFFKKVT